MIKLTSEEFKNLYAEHTQVDLAKQLGVTVQTIAKIAKSLGLSKGKGKGAGRPSKIKIDD